MPDALQPSISPTEKKSNPGTPVDFRSYRFAGRAFLFFAPILFLIASAETLLWKTGETWTIKRVIERQRHGTGVLFMRGMLDQGFYRYKFLQIQERHPGILALGSSRVMEFRPEMFAARSDEFFNAGGMIQDLSDLKQFTRQLNSSNTPKILLLGLDLWWFNGNKPELQAFDAGVARDAARDWPEHARLLRRFKSAKTRQSILNALHARNEHIGIEAREALAGFRRDGSMQYHFAPPQETGWKFVDREKPPIAERIRKGSPPFAPAVGLSAERLASLAQCLNSLTNKNVLVLGFLPPFSSEAALLLQTSPGHSNLWIETRRQLPKLFEQRGLPFVDASLLADLNSNDSCMIDGMHAAETFHLTLLDRLLDAPRAARSFPGLRERIRSSLRSPLSNPWHPDYRPFFSPLL